MSAGGGPGTTTTAAGAGTGTTTTTAAAAAGTGTTTTTAAAAAGTGTTTTTAGGARGTTTTGAGGGGGGPFPTLPMSSSTTTSTTSTTTTSFATGTTTMVPRPPGPPGTYTTPVVASVGAGGTHLDTTAGGATATVSVPAGALPEGTEVALAPVADPAALIKRVPVGQSYVVSFSVSWTAPDGTSPAASAPITLTVVDRPIRAGDHIYVLGPTGSRRQGRHLSVVRRRSASPLTPPF